MKITPRHEKFINALAYSPITIIATMRSKDAYEMGKDNNGRTSVQKVGIGAKQREGFEYEFTVTFSIDQKTNTATAQKDNTHFFENEGAIMLTESHGVKIMEWANSGDSYIPIAYKEPLERKDSKDELLKSTIEEVKEICSSATKNGIDKIGLSNFIAENNDGKKNFAVIKDFDKITILKDKIEDYIAKNTSKEGN